MRRILLLFTAAAMMAVMLAMSAGPASADVKFKFDNDDHRFDRDNGFEVNGPNFDDQELDSGGISTETDISIEGNNNNQCVGALQFGQTGNFANQQGTSQFGDGNGSDSWWWDPWWGWNSNFNGDNEFSGPETEFAPENATECEQGVEQAAAASSWGW